MIKGQIRVMQFIHNSGVTGPGRIVFGLAKYMDKKEFLVDVCCPSEGVLSEELKGIGVRVVPPTLKNLLRLGSYHVLHIHSGQQNALGRILGRVCGVPAIIYTEHLMGDSHEWIKSKWALALHLFLHRLSNACVDRVVAVSDAVRSSYTKRQGVHPDRIVTIYNGVDIDAIKAHRSDPGKIRARIGVGFDVPIVGIIGRLVPEKGYEDFIQAAYEVVQADPRVKFLIIGEGGEHASLEALSKGLGLERNVIFLGFQENILDVVDALDIYIQSSRHKRESFGLAVVEAMAQGKAVIVSSAECFKEIVADGVDGLIYPSGDFKQLSAKILLLLADRSLKEELGHRARQKAEQFDARLMAQKTEGLYKEILQAKGLLK